MNEIKTFQISSIGVPGAAVLNFSPASSFNFLASHNGYSIKSFSGFCIRRNNVGVLLASGSLYVNFAVNSGSIVGQFIPYQPNVDYPIDQSGYDVVITPNSPSQKVFNLSLNAGIQGSINLVAFDYGSPGATDEIVMFVSIEFKAYD